LKDTLSSTESEIICSRTSLEYAERRKTQSVNKLQELQHYVENKYGAIRVCEEWFKQAIETASSDLREMEAKQ